MCMCFCVRCLVVLALLPIVRGDIKAGSVTLKPSGVLSMIAEWDDTPKDGAIYEIYLLTTLRTTGVAQLHKLVNLVFNTTKMSYNIPSGVQNQFVAGNTATIGNFPGFRLDDRYRVYIRYLNASNFLLNKAGGSVEMSLYASPMVQASPPRNVKACDVSDTTSTQCSAFLNTSSVRIVWDEPSSNGYNIYFPTPAYGIEYYIVELSENENYVPVTRSITCLAGEVSAKCNMIKLAVVFYDINPNTVYRFRVRAGTIIGGGLNAGDASCFLGYTGPDGLCSACTAGKYKTVTGNATCTDCVAEKYSTTVAATSEIACLTCPGERLSPSASSSADACYYAECSPGYSGSAEACIICRVGKYKTVSGTATCTDCAAGKYSSTNAEGSVTEDDCHPCRANSISPSGSEGAYLCICLAGYFLRFGYEVDRPCTACPAGTYKSEIGSPDACTNCIAGKSTTAVAATSVSTCLPCESGKYYIEGNACTACAAGTYQNSTGASTCLSCPLNMDTLAQSISSSFCVCAAGTYLNAGSVCTPCPAGTYQNKTGETQCVNCARGTYSPVVAATNASTCLLCPLNSDSPAQSVSYSSCTCNVNYTGEVLS